MLRKLPRIVLLFLLLPLSLFLTLNKHSRTGKDHYRQPVFADAAGYHSYLPYFFIETDKVMTVDSLYRRTGEGFHYTEDGVLNTKYPMGVALLQMPFFLVAHGWANESEATGYSSIYMTAVNIAGITYGWLGLILIALVLKRRFPEWIAYSVPLIIFAGSNLYWYMIDATGMAHVYDFFLSALLIWMVYRFMEKPRLIPFLGIAATASFLLLVRPVDLPLLLLIIYAGVRGHTEWKERWKELFGKPVWIVMALGVAFLIWIPQFLYWKHAFGSFLHYSYTGESFEHWASPKILQVLFSTKNGWWVYSPLMLLACVGVIGFARKGYREGRGIGLCILAMIYLAASWHSWEFGCAYGGRTFIVLYPALAIGLAWVMLNLSQKWKYMLFFAFVVVVISMNMDMIYYYDGCFYGGDWDWDAYLRLFER